MLPARPSEPSSPAPTTQATLLYERMREDILSCALPPGHKLRIDMLRSTHGASASPIREALNRLVSEGLVTQVDQKGFRVAPISVAELTDLMRARCWIGERALIESMRRGDIEWEERVLVAHHRWEREVAAVADVAHAYGDRIHELHRDFHRALLSACGSDWILNCWTSLSERARRYQVLSIRSGAAPERDPLSEHRALRDAVLSRNEGLAVKLHTGHIELTAEIVAAVAAAAGEGNASQGR